MPTERWEARKNEQEADIRETAGILCTLNRKRQIRTSLWTSSRKQTPVEVTMCITQGGRARILSKTSTVGFSTTERMTRSQSMGRCSNTQCRGWMLPAGLERQGQSISGTFSGSLRTGKGFVSIRSKWADWSVKSRMLTPASAFHSRCATVLLLLTTSL